MFKVPFNDTSRIFKQHHAQIMHTFGEIGQSGRWLLGSFNEAFSEKFKDWCGAAYCLPVANGTDALEIALRTILGNDRGDTENPEYQEVITVANAGGYSSIACRLVGAVPVYVDVDENTLLVCFDSLLNSLNPHVKAVIVTHLYGGVVDVVRLGQLMTQKGYGHVPIIEDCAQAHGGKIGSARVGSMGDIATFSFYPTKNLGAMGDAGAITTSNPLFFEKAQWLQQYGWKHKYQVTLPFGRNSRMDELQAGVLLCLLPHVEAYNARRSHVYTQYQMAVQSKKVRFLDYEKNDYVGHLAVAKVSDREAFLSFMQSKNIGMEVHYPILDCDQPAWKNLPMRLEKGNLQVARAAVNEIVSFPCFPTMQDEEVRYVCEALSAWESA